MHDENGDVDLSPGALHPLLVFHVKMVFEEFDSDRDGSLNYIEWKRYAESDDEIQALLQQWQAPAFTEVKEGQEEERESSNLKAGGEDRDEKRESDKRALVGPSRTIRGVWDERILVRWRKKTVMHRDGQEEGNNDKSLPKRNSYV